MLGCFSKKFILRYTMFTSKSDKVTYSWYDGSEIHGHIQRMIPEVKKDIVVILVSPPGSSVLEQARQTTAGDFAQQWYECIWLIPPGKQAHIDANDRWAFTFRTYTNYLTGVIEKLLEQWYTYQNMCISATSMAVPVVAKMIDETNYKWHLLFGAPISDLSQVFKIQQHVLGKVSEEQLLIWYATHSWLTLDEQAMREIHKDERRHCGMSTVLVNLRQDMKLWVYGNTQDAYLSNTHRHLLQWRTNEGNINLLNFDEFADDPFKHKFSPQTEKVLAPNFTLSFLDKLKNR